MSNDITLHNKVTVITNATRDILLDKNPDSLTLYHFYHKKADKDKTNQPYATNGYAMKGLKWGKVRFDKALAVLQELNLIEFVKTKDSKGRFSKTYVKINYIWSEKSKNNILQNKNNHEYQNPQTENKQTLINQQSIHEYQNPQVDTSKGGEQETNAYSNYNINAYSNINLNSYSNKQVKPKKGKTKPNKRKYNEENIEFYQKIIDTYNGIQGKKVVSSYKGWARNCDYWLKTEENQDGYSKEDIIKAIFHILLCPKRWSGQTNLTFFFRQQDSNGNDIDRIGEALERQVPYTEEIPKLSMAQLQAHQIYNERYRDNG